MKYFAYGSNCNPAVMATKGIEFTARTRGSLTGYRLLFNKKALRDRLPEGIGFANICAESDGILVNNISQGGKTCSRWFPMMPT